jgi:uncharacterized membrane protein
VGLLVRHYFNMKNQGRAKQGFVLLPISFALFFTIAWFAAPVRQDLAAGPPVPFADVQQIVSRHCVSCHAAKPANTDFETAPKGVKLETATQIVRDKTRIRQQAVTTQAMPLGNSTNMTEQERLLLGRWIAQGGSAE